MKKLNGFENWVLQTALEYWVQAVEDDVYEKQETGQQNLIYAPGYFTMIAKDLSRKIDEITIKKDLKK